MFAFRFPSESKYVNKARAIGCMVLNVLEFEHRHTEHIEREFVLGESTGE